jgi:hypothetical protein
MPPAIGIVDHPRRSLDEAHTRTQRLDDLLSLNENQVVTRYWSVPKAQSQRKAVMMVVYQLWLWVLDNGTLQFPKRYFL